MITKEIYLEASYTLNMGNYESLKVSYGETLTEASVADAILAVKTGLHEAVEAFKQDMLVTERKTRR